MKVITVCGSMKFKDEMVKVAHEYALNGNCVLFPLMELGKEKISEKEINYLKEAHFKRIELSDLIIVVNKDNYIGDSTKAEIDFAIELGKEVIYYYE